MKELDWKSLTLRSLLLMVASAAPLAFPLSMMGFGSLHKLSTTLILPGAALLVCSWFLLRWRGFGELSRILLRGAIAGALATFALELVRYPAFLAGWMPGNLPDLMGVLLLDRFALGPSTASSLAGFGYHFWNGACFGMIFALITWSWSRWLAVPFGLAIGVGFMASPVVQALGVGLFGVDFGWHFAATVLTAHAAFGVALALLLPKYVLRSDLKVHSKSQNPAAPVVSLNAAPEGTSMSTLLSGRS